MKPTKKTLTLSALIGGAILAVIIFSMPPVSMALLGRSQIVSHVPSRWSFSRFLRRDIGYYLTEDGPEVVIDDLTLLRDEPSQTGVGLPKYYVWVQARSAGGENLSGAARVAAVDRERFDVIQYKTCDELLSDPEAAAVFPDSVKERITQLIAESCAAAP